MKLKVDLTITSSHINMISVMEPLSFGRVT